MKSIILIKKSHFSMQGRKKCNKWIFFYYSSIVSPAPWMKMKLLRHHVVKPTLLRLKPVYVWVQLVHRQRLQQQKPLRPLCKLLFLHYPQFVMGLSKHYGHWGNSVSITLELFFIKILKPDFLGNDIRQPCCLSCHLLETPGERE